MIRLLPIVVFSVCLFALFTIHNGVFAQSKILAQANPPGTSTDVNAPIQAPSGQPGCKLTDLGCLPDDPAGFVQKIYAMGASLVGVVAFLFFSIGGYFILTSQGNPGQISKGKTYIFYSLAGVLLAIFGFVFIEAITGVLKIPGFG